MDGSRDRAHPPPPLTVRPRGVPLGWTSGLLSAASIGAVEPEKTRRAWAHSRPSTDSWLGSWSWRTMPTGQVMPLGPWLQ